MEKSESIIELAKALVKAQGEIKNALKDSINPHFKSRYADLASVWDACREPLTKNGIAVLQPVKADGNLVIVTTMLLHVSGEWLSESLSVPVAQQTAQAVGSAITYARRYGLSAMVGIAPDDDDGEAATRKSAIEYLSPKPPAEALLQGIKDKLSKLDAPLAEKAQASLAKANGDAAKLTQLDVWIKNKLEEQKQ